MRNFVYFLLMAAEVVFVAFFIALGLFYLIGIFQ